MKKRLDNYLSKSGNASKESWRIVNREYNRKAKINNSFHFNPNYFSSFAENIIKKLPSTPFILSMLLSQSHIQLKNSVSEYILELNGLIIKKTLNILLEPLTALTNQWFTESLLKIVSILTMYDLNKVFQ